VWLTEGSRKKVENFLSMSEELCSEFSAEIEERGYPRVRHSMERRVSKKLRPLKMEAESGLETELAEPCSRGWRRACAGRSDMLKLASACQHAPASPPLVSTSAHRPAGGLSASEPGLGHAAS